METDDKNDKSNNANTTIFTNMQGRDGEERVDPAKSGILSLDFDPSKIKVRIIYELIRIDSESRKRVTVQIMFLII